MLRGRCAAAVTVSVAPTPLSTVDCPCRGTTGTEDEGRRTKARAYALADTKASVQRAARRELPRLRGHLKRRVGAGRLAYDGAMPKTWVKVLSARRHQGERSASRKTGASALARPPYAEGGSGGCREEFSLGANATGDASLNLNTAPAKAKDAHSVHLAYVAFAGPSENL